MKKIVFSENNDALAGVVEAVLLVALVAIVLSMIQVVYVPQVMEQKEADHMDEVSNQFSRLKSVIDLQSMVAKDFPVSTTITLGSPDMPYFATAKAYGQIMIVGGTGEVKVDNLSVAQLSSIEFESYNAYFVNQRYVLEGGCVIVNQSDGETVRIEPSITVENLSNELNIRYEIPIIIGVEGKNSTSGYKSCYVRTNYSHSDTNWILMQDVSNINISSQHSRAWAGLLEYLLGSNVNVERHDGYVKVTKKSKQINFYYKRHYIYAQISPGWIT